MDKVQINNICVQSLKTLQDDRVMIPAAGAEAMSDLKTILRGLVNGTYMLAATPQAPAKEPAGEPNE